jgi:hypothetical protein
MTGWGLWKPPSGLFMFRLKRALEWLGDYYAEKACMTKRYIEILRAVMKGLRIETGLGLPLVFLEFGCSSIFSVLSL